MATRDWHAMSGAEALEALGSANEGLDAEEVARRRDQWGPNALREADAPSAVARFGRQLASPLIYLLIAAAVLAFALGDASDAIVILAVVALNAAVGGIQEGRAERALAALRRMAPPRARVHRRDGDADIESREVVPGDVLLVAAGDAIAADARILDAAALQVAEAALTGESVPVGKQAERVLVDTALGDRRSMLYAGTHVAAGRARAVVVATGPTTEIGRIAALAAGARAPRTPLERRIERFGRQVMVAAVAVLALIVAIGLIRGLPLADIAMIGVSQLVGMVPEGLPVAMTIALAVGVQRMASRRAIVRRLAAVETLGSTTVIASDKTGTLTRNEMTVTAVYLPRHGEVAVAGSGYAPDPALAAAPGLVELLEACALCNDAQIVSPTEEEPRWRALGDPTEAALVTLAEKGKIDVTSLRQRHPRRGERPFDAATKMMATEHDRDGGRVVYLKGAPEVVLAMCDPNVREDARRAAEAMASAALRVLAVAAIPGGTVQHLAGATLLGLVGQIDPPRTEVRAAVATCRAAGIRTVMITGDHKATALAIGRELGIADEHDEAVDGAELEALSDEELTARLDRVAVFARVLPAQKLRIVESFQRRGEVVAVTGDGVNDAPALVRADVGVAMGITGTEVAKEAAKIVITDDDFTTIAAAVEEGRVVHRNLKKALLLLCTTSAAEVIVLLAAVALGYPPPFAAVQILWNNLVTEGVITVNLVMEPPEGDEMQQRPTPRDEPLLTAALLRRLALLTPTIVVITLGWFVWRTGHGVAIEVAQTETFTLLVVCEWFNVLNCRSEWRSAFDRGLLRNRWLIGGLVVGNLLQIAVVFFSPLASVFHTVPIGFGQVLAIGAAGSVVLWVEELRKLVARRRRQRDRARRAVTVDRGTSTHVSSPHCSRTTRSR